MSLEVVFDDTLVAPGEVRTLIGADRYGDIVFQRTSRRDAMKAWATAAGADFVTLRSAADCAALLARLRAEDADGLFLFCPSHVLAVGDPADLVTFLKQVRYAPNDMLMPVGGAGDRTAWLLMRPQMAARFLQRSQEGNLTSFFEQYGGSFDAVRDRLHLIDVSKEHALLNFLSAQFDARHFNAMEYDELTVRKRSKDRTKLKREFEFYKLIPPQMQMFLVQPFDFEDDGDTASYSMERLLVPDMALQWVNGALQELEFDSFLARILHFVALRPEKTIEASEADRIKTQLYLTKVRDRIADLKKVPSYSRLEPLLEQAVGGIDSLVERYSALYAQMHAGLRERRLAIGHGDLCFSNILYSKSNRYLKLIDPRGASTEAELYTDRYYDVAKLSHSVIGCYDFINQGKFELGIDEALRLDLTFERPPPEWAAPMFRRRVESAGFDARLVRLYEASLFISMLPLHIERPRKVLAFAVNAALILDELSGKSASHP